MSGIYPNSGVPANQAINTVDVDTTSCPEGELFHSTSRCQPRFDPAAANAVMSEILNAVTMICTSHGVDGAPGVYDCSRLDNLAVALCRKINEAVPLDSSSSVMATALAGRNGLSAWSYDKPTNIAAISADLLLAGTNRIDVSARSMRQLFTNRAVENTTYVDSGGMMNFDGSLGHYSLRQRMLFTTSVAIANAIVTAVGRTNGLLITVPTTGAQYGLTITIPAPRYPGQKMTLMLEHTLGFSDLNPVEMYLAVDAGVTIVGTLRRETGAFGRGLSGSQRGIMRSGESLMLVANGNYGDSVWQIESSHFYKLRNIQNQYTGWAEKDDGYIEIWGQALQSPNDVVVEEILPVQIGNPQDANFYFTDVRGGLLANAGDPLPANVAENILIHIRGANGAVVQFGGRNAFGGAATAANVIYYSPNARLDFAAFGLLPRLPL